MRQHSHNRAVLRQVGHKASVGEQVLEEAVHVIAKLALLLRDVVGLSYNEIADSLEVTLATVKWRIFKAREEVQLALAREGITYGVAEPAALEQT